MGTIQNQDLAGPTNRISRGQAAVLDRMMGAMTRPLSTAETLVVWVGEMGRTPELEYITPPPAPMRNHRGVVFSMALAGAGVRGGPVHGASDRHTPCPKDGPVGPPDRTATLFHCVGLPPHTAVGERLNRLLPISAAVACPPPSPADPLLGHNAY